tara:strand:+ start:112 stop:321 length:210 start_codon:yes stop_codon:yes gene_type:complete
LSKGNDMSEKHTTAMYGVSYDVRNDCPHCGGKELYEMKGSREENKLWFMCITKREQGDDNCPHFTIAIE